MKLNLIGCGNVGQTILRRLADSGLYDIQDVYGPRPERVARAMGFLGQGRACRTLDEMRPADVWFLTVPDTRIAEVADDLARVAPKGPAVAIHCSGFLPASEMASLRALGWTLASAHPALSFADPAVSVHQFAGVHCGLEGDPAAIEIAGRLMQDAGAQVFDIRPGGKALYHAAAVFSSNFTVVLQAIAREAWAEAGVPAEIVGNLNAALLKAASENALAMGPQAALTGPAARGDWGVVLRQGAAVTDWHPEAGTSYRSLSLLARRLKRTGSTGTAVDEEG